MNHYGYYKYDLKQKSTTEDVSKKELTVVPDSLGETTLKLVCTKSFPQTIDRGAAIPVPNNDTALVVDAVRQALDRADQAIAR